MDVKMMSMSATDKQFIDDNMLTDEDFHFDIGEEFEVPYEEKSILESLADNMQIINGDFITSSDAEHMEQRANISDLNEFLKEICKVQFKEEYYPLHNSSETSPEIYSPDKEVSVITIPEVSNNFETAILADTPPPTPHGIIDSLPESPPTNTSFDPLIVSVNSMNGVSYAVPPNSQTLVTPGKYRMALQPKVECNVKDTNGAIMTPRHVEKIPKGRIQLRAPPNVPIPVSKIVENLNAQHDVHKASTKTSSKKNSILSSSDICAAALKRQERMIKNRESAYLSRKRKKEYVMKLETELHQMTAENSSLREENNQLKNKILDLEKEILKLKATFSPNNVKKTACFMVAIFMLTFNLTPYSSIFQKSAPISTKSEMPTHRIGRTLLWDESNSTTEIKNESKSIYHKLKDVSDEDDTYIVDFDKTFNSSSCQHFINKTESLRLENDLLGWVERVEKKRKQTKTKHKFHMENTLPHLATWSRHRSEPNRDIWARKKNKNEILIYETPRKAYEDFFDAIHRRDDTFYFVSFSGDHLLLPAIAHNKTLRPRMSFVMPAMTLNESVGESDDHISMMQIDCEVMDTKLVYIKESVIPEHLRQKHNNTTKHHSKNSPGYSSYQQTKRLHSGNKLPPK